jgi:hypothetical protein
MAWAWAMDDGVPTVRNDALAASGGLLTGCCPSVGIFYRSTVTADAGRLIGTPLAVRPSPTRR